MLVLHNLPLAWRAKKLNLLLASYVFYAAWNPPFIVLLWLSTMVDWFAARRMAVSEGAVWGINNASSQDALMHHWEELKERLLQERGRNEQ